MALRKIFPSFSSSSANLLPRVISSSLSRFSSASFSTKVNLSVLPRISASSFSSDFSNLSSLVIRRNHHSVYVTQKAPEFTGQAVFPDDTIKEISLSSLLKGNRYVCLLFYPLDFTFVCPSELLAFSDAIQEFENRNVQLLGVSVDSQYSHLAWRDRPVNKGGIGKLKFPLLSDLTKQISKDYGCLLNDAVSLRAFFLIDREGVIRHMLVNDLPLGRSVNEALRIVDALQHFEKNGEVCPANWQKGEAAMKPTQEGVASYLSSKHS